MDPDAGDAPALLADRYELGPTIGGGGMGTVRAARDTRLDRPVAVKTLHAHLAADEGMRRRFEDEGRTAARLAHPNVVQVFDSGEADGVPYLVMELVDGPTLAQRIADGPIGVDEARGIAAGIARALAAAHDQGVVHRDIKPANVLLVDGVPKVTDFGIARALEGLDRETTAVILGTPTYVAPECLAGSPATPRSDVYAAGVVLAEMLAGSRVAPGSAPVAPAGPLAPVVARATSTDPADRPADGTELAAALGHPVTRAAGAGTDDGAPTVAMAPAVVAGASTRMMEPRPARREQRRRPAGSRRGSRRLAILGVVLAIAVVLGVGVLAGGSDSSLTPPTQATSTTTTVPATTTTLRAVPAVGPTPATEPPKTPKPPKEAKAPKAEPGRKPKP
jgi:eukaryotic-like serine/threonine-protein kinase